MVTVGSVERAVAAQEFEFLAPDFRGRRGVIRALTHGAPEFVFWIHPGGRLHDARDSHRAHPPAGYEHIVRDEPDYGGFLRGRVVRNARGRQLVVVYCRAEALADAGPAVGQLLDGLGALPLPLDDDALVISDNADLYGTVRDLAERWSG